MPVELGYACLNTALGKEGSFRDMTQATFRQKGLEYASWLALENVTNLCKILEWNSKNGIRVYRMSSSMFPWDTEYALENLPNWYEIRETLELAGKIARGSGQRLSFHPGQFNVLSSLTDKVVDNTIGILTRHGEIMDVMNLPRDHGAKINVHVGSAQGGKDAALDRFCRAFQRLPQTARTRLTVENDDKPSMFTVYDLYAGAYQKVGVPVVMDFHHARLNRSLVPGTQTPIPEKLEFMRAQSTWGSIIPVTHYSESARDYMILLGPGAGKLPSPCAHSDYVKGPIPDFPEFTHHCVIEAKMKEQALLRIRGNLSP
jgi:UV DNA damage endonuclease